MLTSRKAILDYFSSPRLWHFSSVKYSQKEKKEITKETTTEVTKEMTKEITKEIRGDG